MTHHVELTDGGKYNFNSHAHVERDDSVSGSGDITNNFNSHAHVERDRHLISTNEVTSNFNSHAHVERDIGCAKQHD